jgi:hypothetical protein
MQALLLAHQQIASGFEIKDVVIEWFPVEWY